MTKLSCFLDMGFVKIALRGIDFSLLKKENNHEGQISLFAGNILFPLTVWIFQYLEHLNQFSENLYKPLNGKNRVLKPG